jgi:uroporphyrinogen decarboxylase
LEKQVSKKDKAILQVLNGDIPWRRPVWLMRQAGRYLPEYRKLRTEVGNFLDLCYTPKWASEITLQPIRRFGFDAAILFADILLIPNALGLKLEFKQGEGPILQTVGDDKDISKLKYNSSVVAPVFETVALVKKQLTKETTLIGFCGGPGTVAC